MDVDLGQYPLSKKLKNTVEKCVVDGADIRILVNNAGVSHDMPVCFEDMSTEEMERIMGVNNGGALRVTKDVLPFMMNDRSYSVSCLHLCPFIPVFISNDFSGFVDDAEFAGRRRD